MKTNIFESGELDGAAFGFEARLMRAEEARREMSSIQFADKTINVFTAKTLNTEYCFARINEKGATGWRVMKGRPELLGKAVHLYGVSLQTGACGIAIGGRLAIHCFKDRDSTPVYTSKILSLAIL